MTFDSVRHVTRSGVTPLRIAAATAAVTAAAALGPMLADAQQASPTMYASATRVVSMRVFTPHPPTGHAVATRDLPRGTVLAAADIKWVADSANASATIVPDTNIVAPGWVTRRAIRSGETLEAPSVAHADAVSTGDEVDAIYQNDGITLQMKGTAIGGGPVGDHIYVKLDNRRRLRGVITGPHTVRIGQ